VPELSNTTTYCTPLAGDNWHRQVWNGWNQFSDKDKQTCTDILYFGH